jgi:hypothetical protein
VQEALELQWQGHQQAQGQGGEHDVC